MTAARRSIRVALLVCVLCIGLYFLYMKFHVAEKGDELNEETRRALSESIDIRALAPGAVPGHVQALKSADAASREKAALSLWKIGTFAQAATAPLLEAAQDPDPQVRRAVAKALGRTGQRTQDAIPGLLECLKDDHADVRAAAATALAETWRWKPPTEGSGAERPPADRDQTAERRGEGRSNPSEGPPPTRLAPRYEALARKAVPLLTAALRDRDVRVRAGAAEALVETGPLAEPAVGELVQILQKDTESSARLQATLALRSIGPAAKAAVPILVEKVRSEKNDGVRITTAFTLGMIGSSPKIVVPALVETLLKDGDPDVRNAAMASIDMFGPEAKLAIPLLQEAAKEPRNQQSPEVMQNINRLLDHLQGRRTGPGGTAPENPSPPAQGPSRN